jgi:hypothetical protein
MAKITEQRKSVVKKTNQGGNSPKTSSMNKTMRSSFKRYRGQGR